MLIMEIVVLNIMQNVDFLYLKMVLVLLVVDRSKEMPRQFENAVKTI